MTWQNIPGWFGFQKTYDRFIAESKDGDTLVEIGVAFGRSLAYLCEGLMAANKRVTVYAIDPWIDDRWEFPQDYPIDAPRPGWGGEHAELARSQGGPFSSFLHNLRTHSPLTLEYAKVLRCRSTEAHRMIGPCRGVLIDGSHDYENVIQDIAVWRPHIIPGGILAGDDYSTVDFPGVVKAVEETFGRSSATGGREYNVEGTTWWVRR